MMLAAPCSTIQTAVLLQLQPESVARVRRVCIGSKSERRENVIEYPSQRCNLPPQRVRSRPIPLQPAAGGVAASPAPSTGNGTQTASVVQVWDQFCVSKVPYTLLALTQDASFDVVQPEGPLPTVMPGYTAADQIACDSVGVFRDKQIVVCRGPQLFSFTLKISSAASEDFQVPLKECPLPHEQAPTEVPSP